MRAPTIAGAMVMCGWLIAGAVTGAAGAEAPAMPVRSFDRFEFDATTAQGLWAELATAYAREDEHAAALDVLTVAPRLVYGGERAEAGLTIPYEHVEAERSGFFGTLQKEENGIGDISLYGKLLPLHTELLDGALGLDVSFPTGDDDKGLGAGEVGFLPFGAAGLHLGRADLRAHFGYRAFTASNERFGVERAPNFLVYGGGVFAALTDHIGVRAEVVGLTLDAARESTPVSFEPGVDLRLPLDGVALIVRPTGLVGLTSDAPDWGIGGGIVLAWDPNRTR